MFYYILNLVEEPNTYLCCRAKISSEGALVWEDPVVMATFLNTRFLWACPSKMTSAQDAHASVSLSYKYAKTFLMERKADRRAGQPFQLPQLQVRSTWETEEDEEVFRNLLEYWRCVVKSLSLSKQYMRLHVWIEADECTCHTVQRCHVNFRKGLKRHPHTPNLNRMQCMQKHRLQVFLMSGWWFKNCLAYAMSEKCK